jgi:hypothetical protein
MYGKLAHTKAVRADVTVLLNAGVLTRVDDGILLLSHRCAIGIIILVKWADILVTGYAA